MATEQSAEAAEDIAERGQPASSAIEQATAVFDALADGVFVYDAEGRLLRANPAGRALLGFDARAGYDPESAWELGNELQVRDDEGRPVPREQWPPARVLRGETLDGAQTVDLLLRTLDGQDKHVNVSGRPLRDAEGRVIGGVTVMRDMTERWRLQHRAHEAFVSLVQMAETLVRAPETEHDPHGHDESDAVVRHLLELARTVLGCERASIVAMDGPGGTQRPVAAAGFAADEERAWRDLVEGGTITGADADPATLARFLAGEVVVVDMREPPWRNQENPLGRQTVLVAPLRIGNELIGMLTIDHGALAHRYTPDGLALAGAVARLAALTLERERLLREREEARATVLALRETKRHMDELLSVASHELRTPLTSVKSAVQIAERRLRALGDQDESAVPSARALEPLLELFSRANGQINRMNRIVGDLLDISRIDANHLQLHLARGDLTGLLRAVVQDLRESYPSRVIAESVPREAVYVELDAGRIAQVMANYITNALRYSPVDAPVHVQVCVDRATAWVRVRDHGPGLTPEQQQRIWNRYERIAAIQVQDLALPAGGLGLGLYISRMLIERHGGTVGVESTPGEGSVFFFSLPRAQPQQPA